MVRITICIFIIIFSLRIHADEKSEKPLILQAELVGEYPFYPGQKAKVAYTIAYKGEIQLTEEQLPLLEAQGFQKIGGLEIKETTKGDYNVQILSQRIKATQAGVYNFQSSLLKGISNNTIVQAEAPPYKIEVSPFPQKDKPMSFNGALGQWMITVQNLSSSKVTIGDSIQLQVTFTGSGEVDTLLLPDLQCQPGFSGFFQMTDIAEQTQNEEISKAFLVTLWPLSESIHQIPVIHYSSFNPKDGKYFSTSSKPIPITVLSSKKDSSHTQEKRVEEILWENEGKKILSPRFTNYALHMNQEIENAFHLYNRGLEAKTLKEKKEYFNHSLFIYVKNEHAVISNNSRAKLFFNIGNCYFSLGEYPWAILYYEKALSIIPQNHEIRENLKLAKSQLGIPLLSNQYISQSEIENYLVYSLSLAGLLSLLSLLFPKLKNISLYISLLSLLFLFFAIYKQYFTPLYAVQITPSFLYQDIDFKSKTDLIVLPGSTVKIMEVQDEGKAIKILTPDSHVGYVLDSTIRII